jgi:hypothetical protein
MASQDGLYSITGAQFRCLALGQQRGKNTFNVLKAHCAPISLGFQGRRTDQPPSFFLPALFKRYYLGPPWGQLLAALLEYVAEEKLPLCLTVSLRSKRFAPRAPLRPQVGAITASTSGAGHSPSAST